MLYQAQRCPPCDPFFISIKKKKKKITPRDRNLTRRWDEGHTKQHGTPRRPDAQKPPPAHAPSHCSRPASSCDTHPGLSLRTPHHLPFTAMISSCASSRKLFLLSNLVSGDVPWFASWENARTRGAGNIGYEPGAIVATIINDEKELLLENDYISL